MKVQRWTHGWSVSETHPAIYDRNQNSGGTCPTFSGPRNTAPSTKREGARDRTISTLPPAAWIPPEAFLGNEALDGLEGLNVGYSIHQQHTKKKNQIEYGKHEQAARRLPFLVIAPTYLP